MKKIILVIGKLSPFFFMMLFAYGCARPRIEQQPAPLLKYYTDYNNFSHQTGQSVRLNGNLQISGTEKLTGVPIGSIVEYGGYLLFNTANGYLYSAPKADISRLVNVRLGKGCATSPTIHNGVAYLSFLNGNYGLVAYDLSTAKEIWKVSGRFSASSPVIARGLLIHCTDDGKLTAYNIRNHKEEWSTDSGNRINASIAASDSQIYICGQNGLIQSYAVRDGTLQWSTRTDDHFYTPPMLIDEVLYTFSFGGMVYQFDAKTGQELTHAQTSASIYLGATNDKNNIYVCSADEQVTAFRQNTLKKLWQSAVKGPASTAPVAIQNELLVPTASRMLYRINSANGEIIQALKLKHRVTVQPLFSADRIFIGNRTASLLELKTSGERP